MSDAEPALPVDLLATMRSGAAAECYWVVLDQVSAADYHTAHEIVAKRWTPVFAAFAHRS